VYLTGKRIRNNGLWLIPAAGSFSIQALIL
jgi:hypothetical protein